MANIVGLFGILSGLPMLLFLPAFQKRMTKKNVLLLSTAIYIVGDLMTYFGKSSAAMLIAGLAKRKHRGLEEGVSRSFFIMENKKIVSTASTAAENSLSAMVVGVATLESYKKKGYATQCMVKLCNQLLEENKELCLFYDNPSAGAIYKRIGFEDIDFCMMYLFKKD